MKHKVRNLLVAGIFSIGVSALGVAAVAAHVTPRVHSAVQAANQSQVSDTDTAQVGPGPTGDSVNDNQNDAQTGQTGQVGESVNDNKEDAQKGQTGRTGEHVSGNQNQTDSGNADGGQQGQAGGEH